MNSLLMPVVLWAFSVAFFVQELAEDEPNKLTVVVFIFAAVFASVAMYKMSGMGWQELNLINMAG